MSPSSQFVASGGVGGGLERGSGRTPTSEVGTSVATTQDRLILERLTAGDLDSTIARFVWGSDGGERALQDHGPRRSHCKATGN
jgi:hypothetical protein